MLHATGGGFSTYLHVACLFWAVCLPGLWSLLFVSFSLPFLGAFFLSSLARFLVGFLFGEAKML
jgi:hypothetical protein